jgi:two-component system response regulator RegX3
MRHLLEEEGYAVTVVNHAAHVVQQVVGLETSLVLLDVDLPDMSGFDLLRLLRAQRYSGPCIYVTARGDIVAKVHGFDVGADDYVVTPFDPAEFVARMRSVIRRCKQTDRLARGTVVQSGDAELSLGDLSYHSSVIQPTLLTPTEMRLLEVLMRNSDSVVSREALIDRVWGYEPVDDSNRIDVYIRRIRRKIEVDPDAPRYLQTVRGHGYIFRAHAADGSGEAEDVCLIHQAG